MPPLRHADMPRRSDAPALVNLCVLQFPPKGNFVGTDNPNPIIHEAAGAGGVTADDGLWRIVLPVTDWPPSSGSFEVQL